MRILPVAALLLVATACGQSPSAPPTAPGTAISWVTAAAQPMSTTRPTPARDETCRQLLRSTASGERIRVRLSNATSPTPLRLRGVTVALRTTGAAVAATRPVTVGGRSAVTVPAGGYVTSDSVRLPVVEGSDVAVTFAVAGTSTLSAHLVGAATSWCTGPGSGDHTRDVTAAEFRVASRLGLVVEALEVPGNAGILAIGDSLTDPPLPPDTYSRWSDVVAARTSRPVANVGIGGNRVLLPGGYGAPLAERLDRDVLSRPGATTAVLFAGTNDVSAGVSARALIQGLTALCRRLHDHHIRVVLVTLAPAYKRPPAMERTRQDVNGWIRTTPEADVHLDADALLRDPARPTRLLPSYDWGDGLHLSAAGHRALGAAIAQRLEPTTSPS